MKEVVRCAEYTMMQAILLWLSLLSSVFIVNAELRELAKGDHCSLRDNSTGICRAIQDCPSLLAKLESGTAPSEQESCSFEGPLQIVCCVDNVVSNTTDTPGEGRGELSRQKCLEFGKYVYELRKSPISDQLINVTSCTSSTSIIENFKAAPGEFPHMAAIGFNTSDGEKSWLCGGSLVSESFVMTAAHCAFSIDWGAAAWIRVGDLNLVSTNDDAMPQERRIVEVIRHPDYRKPSAYNDIALLRMDSPVQFTRWVRPACLHTHPSTNTSKAIATGWGSTEFGDEKLTDHLKRLIIPLAPQSKCNASYPPNRQLQQGFDPETMICAGDVGKDTCQGDGGSPLAIHGSAKCMYDVIGITSLGKLCGGKDPSIYTRVYHYVPWLESILWPKN